ncbi:MAG: prepilin-type N-terminal cleavage/methylation domain-containing protein [Phycisphaerales bacterium]|nr:prepilin-type N-terminal cleavage/methylation domain-containing protein [Phycisphaerales bacterium]
MTKCKQAFTLVELLAVLAVISLLLTILLPMLGSSMERAREFKCQMSQRTVAFDFRLFADDQLHGDRGDDHNRPSFALETFQENQYGVDEFWRWGDDSSAHETPDDQGNDPMRCPSVREPIVLRKNVACSNGAVGPPQNISYGFNARLNRAEVTDQFGRPTARPVRLKPSIMQYASVPLLLDIDGNRAFELNVSPIYTAPSLDSQGPYANDRLWFPSSRHNGRTNVAFIDGHVESSSDPAGESSWKWEFQPVN